VQAIIRIHHFFCGASTRFRVMASPYGISPTHPFDTPLSVGLLWTSDQSDAETSTWQHTTLTKHLIHVPGWALTRNRSKGAAADSRLRPRGHCDQRIYLSSSHRGTHSLLVFRL